MSNRPLTVTLYSKPGCHLCDDVHELLAPLQRGLGFELHTVNILDDPALFAKFQYLIPVVDIDGGPALYPPIDAGQLRKALLQALRSRAGRLTT